MNNWYYHDYAVSEEHAQTEALDAITQTGVSATHIFACETEDLVVIMPDNLKD